ncbi:MAG: NAD-dependent epimerase/dehydratase family protein [Cyclobacteriaceae bacterium]
MQSVLITGGLGNLGSWLTHFFVEQGLDVTVLTKNKRKMEFDASFKTIACDISDLSSCQKVLTQAYDVIIHTASVNDNFVDDYANKALKVNALGTRNILESIQDNPPKHFIYFSTFHVYGKYSGEITEETELVPMNDYGTTHLFAEYYVKQFNKTNGIPYSIIRLSNSYGCPKDYASSKWYLILNDLSKMAFTEQKIVLKGNGLASRDFIWMGDVCRVIHELSQSVPENEVYNLSSEQAYSLLDVAKEVQKAYKETYDKEIEIQTNKEDASQPRPPVAISSQKIKQKIPFEGNSKFYSEALNIFHFLSKE